MPSRGTIEFDQQVDPINPDHWFTLTIRCRGCGSEADVRHATGREAQRWINLFTMFHERANCGWDPHRGRQ